MLHYKLDMLAHACCLDIAYAWSAIWQAPNHTFVVLWSTHHTHTRQKCLEASLLLFAGNSDIALQHAMVHPGGFMLEDTLLLVEAKTDLSQEALVMASLVHAPCQLQ